jgi:hypothetical protein
LLLYFKSYYDSPYKKILEQNFPQSNGGRIAVALPFITADACKVQAHEFAKKPSSRSVIYNSVLARGGQVLTTTTSMTHAAPQPRQHWLFSLP